MTDEGVEAVVPSGRARFAAMMRELEAVPEYRGDGASPQEVLDAFPEYASVRVDDLTIKTDRDANGSFDPTTDLDELRAVDALGRPGKVRPVGTTTRSASASSKRLAERVNPSLEFDTAGGSPCCAVQSATAASSSWTTCASASCRSESTSTSRRSRPALNVIRSPEALINAQSVTLPSAQLTVYSCATVMPSGRTIPWSLSSPGSRKDPTDPPTPSPTSALAASSKMDISAWRLT